MKKLFAFVLVMSSCSENHNKSTEAGSTRLDSTKNNTNADAPSNNQALFFKIADTSKDIKHIDSFFALVYSNKEEFLIKNVQKFLPSNEDEISYVDAHFKNRSLQEKMEDSMYNEINIYKSRFFPALVNVIRSAIPKQSSITTRFAGFDVLDSTSDDPYDTTHVNYDIYAEGSLKKMRFVFPYIRDKTFSIENIYFKNGESVLERACACPEKKSKD